MGVNILLAHDVESPDARGSSVACETCNHYGKSSSALSLAFIYLGLAINGGLGRKGQKFPGLIGGERGLGDIVDLLHCIHSIFLAGAPRPALCF